jgi:2-methyl-3-hydroxypyridine 5-carboxylic acid dioxygenase
MTARRHAEIAGAGFAGLTAAIALTARGWSVRVHEASPELRAFGAGIFIWENGLRVLKAVGAYAEVMQGAHEAVVYETRHDGRLLDAHSFTPDKGTRMLTMTRQHLYSALIRAAQRHGIEIITGSEAVGATREGVLITADGGSFAADLVVGADGVGSKVRDSIGLLQERHVYVDGIVRVLAPRPQEKLGPGNWDHVIDFWNMQSRPLRVLYVPCNARDLYLAMMAPVADQEATAIPLRTDIWMTAFPQLTPVIRSISVGGRYDAYETTKLKRWSRGRVAIIGDAAHAMTPTLGQGAGTAMMNALSLAVALEQEPAIERALARWEERERPLTEHTQDCSAQIANERRLSRWDNETLRAANRIPAGTEHFGPLVEHTRCAPSPLVGEGWGGG